MQKRFTKSNFNQARETEGEGERDRERDRQPDRETGRERAVSDGFAG